MPIHWDYMPAPEGAGSEMARRRATNESFQAGHFHDQAQIVAVFEGWRSFATPIGTFRAEAGDILAIPSRMFHAPLMSDKSSVLVLFLDNYHPISQRIHRPSVARGQGARRLEDILDRVASCLASDWVDERRELSSMLTEFIMRDDSSIGDIAEKHGYSPDGFIRLFRKLVGTTPAKYRVAHRLTMVRSMIREGAALADAAFAAGFADQSHLGRCFLRAYGTTPAAYRAGLLGF